MISSPEVLQRLDASPTWGKGHTLSLGQLLREPEGTIKSRRDPGSR